MTGLWDRLRARRLERAELRLADLEDHHDKWGWSYTPSREAQAEKAIAKAKERIRSLGGSRS